MSDSEKIASVLVENGDGYAVITLNRPDKLNAFNAEMHHQLRQALDAAEQDERCRAVLLTGAGKGFCTGQDLSDRVFTPDALPDLSASLNDNYNPLIRRIRSMSKPVIAAVNGVAAGAGANVALACDIVVAARSARFIQSFSKLGLIPDAGGTWTLPRLIGDARARALAILAEPVSAELAAEWGMIWKVVDDADLDGYARQLCGELAARPTKGFALLKQAFLASASNDLSEQLDLEARLQGEAGRTDDYRTGVEAFRAKQTPAFKGR